MNIPSSKSFRILIADDHETVRKGIGMILSSQKHLTVCGEASDGLDAIAKTEQLHPDLVVLDITMPQLGGIEAAKEIRKLYAKLPILFLSMHQGRHLIEMAKSIPVQGFVSKSEVAQTLLDAVDTLLENGTFFGNVD